MKILRVIFLSLSFWLASVFPVLASPVDINPYGLLFTGRQTVTTTATALASHAAGEFCVKADDENGTVAVYFGAAGVTTATGQKLNAGESTCLRLSNTNKFFVVASTTGAEVTYHGLN